METNNTSKRPAYLFAPQTEKKTTTGSAGNLLFYLIGIAMMSLLLMIIFATN